MKYSRCARAAIVATINQLASGSRWLALPALDTKSGIIFVHKRAAALFGMDIKTSDFFSSAGEPSRLAVEIHGIANAHGLITQIPAMTACPILIQASEETMLHSEEQQ
ncbi:MAG: hypothetical protein WCO94_03855 [Verrucomicrobiota bacterium]